MKEQINSIIKTFFDKLSIPIESIEIIENGNNIFSVKIQSQESGLLIGPHGKNIEVLQYILKLISSRMIKQRIKLHLEINDYIESKDQKLFDFIESKINIVEKSGKNFQLPFFNSYERKKIHSYVAEHENKNISTKSQGEGKERRMFICNNNLGKSQKSFLNIDIDGDDI